MDRDSITAFQLEKPTSPDSALNYEFLRAKGLSLVQRYAGSKWTDYNLHDPGVTILEYLCYAITDLAYRSRFDIADILAGKDGKVDLQKNLFYSRHQILTSKPVLINDFRKLIIDSVPEVHNAWLIPVTDAKGKEGSKGLYNVLIQVNNDQVNKYLNAELSPEDKELYKNKIIDQVKAVVNAQRSLGEDYHSFIVLNPVDVEIEAEVVVEKHQMHEEILADVYEMLIRTITPPIHFYSESQLEKEGWLVEDIYSGPPLKHGFIKDEELKDRVNTLDPSDMVQSILNVAGVKYVRNFVIRFNNAEYDFRPAYLDENTFPRLVFDIRNPGIKIFNTSHELPVKTSIFSGLLYKKADNARRKYIKGYGSEELRYIHATNREIDAYYSIQHLFPHLYRLNSDEIEGAKQINEEQDPDINAEKAKVKQLKAYIMLFEQVMVNYLAQLSNISNIITADIDLQTAQPTYFTGNLYEVPGAGNILADFMTKGGNQDQVDWEYFKNDPENAYLKFLNNAVESDEVYFDRKKRVLDHLLSRFDIALMKYPLQLYYQMYHTGDEKAQKFAELKWKSDILKRLVLLGAQRNQGVDHTDQFTERRSGYDNLIASYLYIPDTGIKNISSAFEQNLGQCAITSSNHYESFDLGKKTVYEVNWDDEKLEMLINETLLDTLLSSPDEETELEQVKLNLPSQRISFLKEGIHHKHYRIGQEINGKGFIVLYKPPEKRQWIRVGKFLTREKAQQQLNQFIDTLKQISIQSEGFHTLEHILLRPNPESAVFGFQLFDDRGLLLLQQDKWMDFDKRAETIDTIIEVCERIKDTGNQSLLNELEGLCQINLSQDRLYTWLVSPVTLQSAYREQLDQFVRKIIHAIHQLQTEYPGKYPAIKKTVSYSKETEFDEQFFYFSMSVVLPAWPARFQEDDFHEFTESLFREHAPAHIKQQFLWLSLKEMKRFESVYFPWLAALKNDKTSSQYQSLCKELILMLVDFKNSSS